MTQKLISIEDRDYLVNMPQDQSEASLLETGIPNFIFAHGAGAPMDSDYMNAVADEIAKQGFRVIRFEFPYMKQRRLDGKKRPPNKENICLASWQTAVEDWQPLGETFISGKSMGGRMASILASKNAELNLSITGVICLGYPFHAPGKTDKWKTDHFPTIEAPMLICQGERDPFGKREEIEALQESQQNWPNAESQSNISLRWVEDGDHDFKPRVKSGTTQLANFEATSNTIKDFINNLVW